MGRRAAVRGISALWAAAGDDAVEIVEHVCGAGHVGADQVVTGVGEQDVDCQVHRQPGGLIDLQLRPGERFPKLGSELPWYPEIPVSTTGVVWPAMTMCPRR